MANQRLNAVGSRYISILASSARTATPDTFEVEVPGKSRGVVVVVDATAVTATPALTVKVQGVDRISGKTWDIITSAAIATVSTVVLKIRPGITVAANAAVADALPPVIRIMATHGDADSITYSIGLNFTD
jgi:hypothetical protein